jgi:hypothetical protein
MEWGVGEPDVTDNFEEEGLGNCSVCLYFGRNGHRDVAMRSCLSLPIGRYEGCTDITWDHQIHEKRVPVSDVVEGEVPSVEPIYNLQCEICLYEML